MRTIAFLCLVGAVLTGAQQPPARDATRPQRRIGTGVIRGRVIAGDTGAPIRHSTVSVYGDAQPPAGGSAITDAAGRFAIEKLPADTYHISVHPSRFHTRYLARPLPGIAAAGEALTITVRDGEIVDAVQVTLARAAAIVGHVVDENGDPLTGIAVTTERARGTPDSGFWRSASTDDSGRFRLFNLAPGEYYVLARGGEIENTGFGERPDAFLATYAPGTTSRAEAMKVRAEAGRDVSVDIRMTRGRTFRVSGTLLDSEGRPVTRGEAGLARYDRWGGTGVRVSVDAASRFMTPHQPPGEYRLNGRELDENGTLLGYVDVPITIADSDVTDVILMTKPPVRLTGRVLFLEGTPTPQPSIQIAATTLDRRDSLEGSVMQGRSGADLAFTIPRVFGEVILRPNGLPTGWYLKAVFRGTEDITDQPTEFTPKDAAVQVVLSSRMSTVEGRIVDAGSAGVAGNTVLLFSEDPAAQRSKSSRFHYAFTDRKGHFRFTGVHAGRYFITALPRTAAEGYHEAGPDFFEPLVREATSILVGEDEQRSVDVKLATGIQH
jgi:protocatechuate 3,4-dioxygenase beta subunit